MRPLLRQQNPFLKEFDDVRLLPLIADAFDRGLFEHADIDADEDQKQCRDDVGQDIQQGKPGRKKYVELGDTPLTNSFRFCTIEVTQPKEHAMDQEMQRRMHEGDLYLSADPDLVDEQLTYLNKLYDYNHTRPSEIAKREQLLRSMFAEIGDNCYIEPPFRSNWGGKHVHFGDWVYANFNLTLVDDTHIYVGSNTMFGPNVTLATAGHPIEPALREKGYQYNAPIRIGKNCWLGAGVIVLPGVTIGDNTVIGAGSVVTRDIPSDVVAVGSPCRVLRPIGEHDKQYYFRDRRIPDNLK